MDNIIQTERIHYEQICGERRSEIRFHDLMNNCPGKNKNLQPQGSISPFFSSVFFSEAPTKRFSRKTVLKFRKIPWKTSVSVVIFCLSRKASTSISTERIAQYLVLGILKQIFPGISLINCCTQKQPLQVNYKKAALNNFVILTRKQLCCSLYLIKFVKLY